MNVVSVVVLASPPRDPIRSKHHNGRRLRALHTYSAPTSPPPRSSKVWWSGRWDQKHDGVVLMVESICRQGFAYSCEVEERRQKVVKLELEKATYETSDSMAADQKLTPKLRRCHPFIGGQEACEPSMGLFPSTKAKLEPHVRSGSILAADWERSAPGVSWRARPSLAMRPARRESSAGGPGGSYPAG
jgi:hypothetical protein